MNQVTPAPAGSAAQPPAAPGGGFSSPATTPRKGGLSIAVIAAVQTVFAREEQKQMQLQGPPTLGLQPGWGGQGT